MHKADPSTSPCVKINLRLCLACVEELMHRFLISALACEMYCNKSACLYLFQVCVSTVILQKIVNHCNYQNNLYAKTSKLKPQVDYRFHPFLGMALFLSFQVIDLGSFMEKQAKSNQPIPC